MTPQMALQQTMAAMNAKAQALTGIALPKYYNPAAVNPLKYAEQVQKRKLLWQTAEKVVVSSFYCKYFLISSLCVTSLQNIGEFCKNLVISNCQESS